MTSSIAWIDHSEFERRRTAELLKQFEEKDTVDELGIGTIRDAISDLLFPGTSIIQTRARYFLFIPWIYLYLERKKVSSSEVESRARSAELKLIDPLLNSEDAAGTIGRLAKGTLKTLPSAIYWQGLGRWGIRLYRGNRSAYHASLDRHYARTGRMLRAEDGDPVDALTPNWHRGLPSPPSDFPQKASFQLRHTEAEYLADRINLSAPASLLNYLLRENASELAIEVPWELPDLSELPPRHKRELEHARIFSEIMNGAPLLYNLMLSELCGRVDRIDDYRGRLGEWSELMSDQKTRFRRWSLIDFWQLVASSNSRVSVPARLFVERWVDLVLRAEPGAVVHNSEARKLIADRERAIKRGLARVDNPRAREVWRGESGTRQIDYRWSAIVRRLIADIHEGMSV